MLLVSSENRVNDALSEPASVSLVVIVAVAVQVRPNVGEGDAVDEGGSNIECDCSIVNEILLVSELAVVMLSEALISCESDGVRLSLTETVIVGDAVALLVLESVRVDDIELERTCVMDAERLCDICVDRDVEREREDSAELVDVGTDDGDCVTEREGDDDTDAVNSTECVGVLTAVNDLKSVNENRCSDNDSDLLASPVEVAVSSSVAERDKLGKFDTDAVREPNHVSLKEPLFDLKGSVGDIERVWSSDTDAVNEAVDDRLGSTLDKLCEWVHLSDNENVRDTSSSLLLDECDHVSGLESVCVCSTVLVKLME